MACCTDESPFDFMGGAEGLKAWLRHTVLLLIDAAAAAFAVYCALFLRFDGVIPSQYITQLPTVVPLFVAVRIGGLWAFQAYGSLWRYATMREFGIAGVAVAVGSVFLFSVGTLTPIMTLPRSVFAIEVLVFSAAAGLPRLYVRWRRGTQQRRRGVRGKRVLIVGAGDAGAMLAREFEQQPWHGVQVVGFVDDDVSKVNRQLGGVPVLGTREDIAAVVERYDVASVIIAMPSAPAKVVRETMALCKETGAALKLLPPLAELMSGKVTVQDVRDVEIEDLLRRDPVETDLTAIRGYLHGKRVLVTGAGGSIGGELCRQVCGFEPAQLVLVDHSENSVFEIDLELRNRFPETVIVPVIADIRNQEKMNRVFARWQPEVVFHAAAHKHVPLMEANPEEAVANNVLGTRNVAEAAARHGAERFVMVSTDKAVNPGNVMGATKRMAELVVQGMQGGSPTRFVSVRFGNVLGSRGSVIPLFREQIRGGGPVKVTHPEMTRYFMTIPEAVQLILQAAAMGQGGEVFVLDMGEPVRIADLANDLIRLSGLEPGVDIKIEYTGVRPGEKLFEELVYDNETICPTSHDKVMALSGHLVEPLAVERTVRRLEQLLASGPEAGATPSAANLEADSGAAFATGSGPGARSEAGPVSGSRNGADAAAGVKAWTAQLVALLYDAVGGQPVEVPAGAGTASVGGEIGAAQGIGTAEAAAAVEGLGAAEGIGAAEAAAAVEAPDLGVLNG